MGWAYRSLVVGLLLVGGAAGCQNKMMDENKALYDENRALRQQNDQLTQQLAMAKAPAPVQPAAQLAPPPAPPPAPQAPVAADAETAATPQLSVPKQVEQIGGQETTISKSGNTIVHLPSDVFFDPGSATLKTDAKKSLDKVAASLKKSYSTQKIVVQGHTDDTPIRVSKWASNMELSVARADAVRQYLITRGIEQDRLSVKGLGDTKPRSKIDRSKNRRVEIVVMTGTSE
jgi:outer membrane protein OmpA-like peptidoglycan-associated protein